MRNVLGLVLAVAMIGSTAAATDLDLTVRRADDDLTSIVVAPGETVNYEVVGVLSDTLNTGLALFGFDLEFDGGALNPVDSPTAAPMNNFDRPLGITNPAGFGGTTDVAGREGDLVQVGGGQNTINNGQTECDTAADCPGTECVGGICDPVADFPVGSVITNLGYTEIVLATGTLTAPDTGGVYTLALTNPFANVIADGETGDPFWAALAVGQITTTNLTIEVDGCVIVSTFPPDCAIDARQPSEPNGDNPAGWDSVDITFSGGCDVGAMGPGDFTVTLVPAGTPPTITDVTKDGSIVTLHLSSTIPTGAWTCFDHSAGMTCVGSLPADVNSDGSSVPTDILAVIDNLNGQVDPPFELWQCDVDRSDLCAPADILRVIDLLNGADEYIVWNGQTIPACPSTAP